MHELSIALSILDVAAEEATRHGAARVKQIHLRLGPLSGVVKEALLAAYDLARQTSDEATSDAELVVEEVAVTAVCPNCRATRAVVSIQELFCTECGTPTPELESGRELEVFALEIQ
jgi:hydrogenase nickel incorporation protein HypA/HybF